MFNFRVSALANLHLFTLVMCGWSAALTAEFHQHAVPSACVNLIFNQIDTEVAEVTVLHTEAITLNLGTRFHCFGVQFFPRACCPSCAPNDNWRRWTST